MGGNTHHFVSKIGGCEIINMQPANRGKFYQIQPHDLPLLRNIVKQVQ